MEAYTMSQVIRISDELYQRLEEHASGFDSPSKVIERILDAYDGVIPSPNDEASTSLEQGIQPSNSLEIIYVSATEDEFKQELLKSKRAFIKIYYTNGTSEIKQWNATKFNESSRLDGNLRSGYLRSWEKKGIYKAELSIDQNQII